MPIDKEQMNEFLEGIFGTGLTKKDFERGFAQILKAITEREKKFNAQVLAFQKMV